MDMTPQTWPEWYDGRHINEVLFCQQFLEKHPMKCVRGRLFTVDGLIEDEGQIGNLILEEISGVLTANLSKTVANLLASIKLQAYSPPLPIETDRIHVANGTYFMDGSFTPNKSYCNNRLTVSYNPDAPTPKRWLQFLSELLQPEDIPTLQEFLGYCLLPTTLKSKGLSGSRYFCRNMPHKNGKTEKSSGTPWRKSRRPRTADLPVSSSWRCP